MRVLLFDMEADGLLEEVEQIHCCVAKEMITGKTIEFFDPIEGVTPDMHHSYPLKYLRPVFANATTLIGHNIIGYDMELLSRFFKLDEKMESVNVIDTLIWSQALNPDRQLPKGCPTVIPNPLTGKNIKVTPHSVAAWGYRLGQEKPKHFDWTHFSFDMLLRCRGDVSLQEKIFYALMKEAQLEPEEVFA